MSVKVVATARCFNCNEKIECLESDEPIPQWRHRGTKQIECQPQTIAKPNIWTVTEIK